MNILDLPNEILLDICSFIPDYRCIRTVNSIFYNIIENNVQILLNIRSPLRHITTNNKLQQLLNLFS